MKSARVGKGGGKETLLSLIKDDPGKTRQRLRVGASFPGEERGRGVFSTHSLVDENTRRGCDDDEIPRSHTTSLQVSRLSEEV